MKLVRLLANQLAVWPVKNGVGIVPVDAITQGVSGNIHAATNNTHGYSACKNPFGTLLDVATDTPEAFVTKAEWLLEQKRVIAEKWDGKAGTMPPANAICTVVSGGVSWVDNDKWLIGQEVEVLAVVNGTDGQPVVVCEAPTGGVYAFVRECLVRAKTEAEERAEQVDDMAKMLFNDCRLGSGDRSTWDTTHEELRNFYRTAINVGWVKP